MLVQACGPVLRHLDTIFRRPCIETLQVLINRLKRFHRRTDLYVLL